MKVKFDVRTVTVTREESDPKAKTESHFWFQLRNHLNGQKSAPMTSINSRWRRVRPCETEGNLTGMPFALAKGRDWRELISDGMYAVRCPREEYNRCEEVTLDYGGVGVKA